MKSGTRSLSILVVVLAVALAALVAGCSASPVASAPSAAPAGVPAATPVTTPTIKVLAPAANAAIKGSELTVRVETTGLKLVDPSNTRVAGEGHVHFTLDDKPVQMSVTPDFTFKDIAAGPHTLRAELVQNDTTPFAPEVFVTVTFTVE